HDIQHDFAVRVRRASSFVRRLTLRQGNSYRWIKHRKGRTRHWRHLDRQNNRKKMAGCHPSWKPPISARERPSVAYISPPSTGNKPLRTGNCLKFYTATLLPSPHSPEVRNHPSFAWAKFQYM